MLVLPMSRPDQILGPWNGRRGLQQQTYLLGFRLVDRTVENTTRSERGTPSGGGSSMNRTKTRGSCRGGNEDGGSARASPTQPEPVLVYPSLVSATFLGHGKRSAW